MVPLYLVNEGPISTLAQKYGGPKGPTQTKKGKRKEKIQNINKLNRNMTTKTTSFICMTIHGTKIVEKLLNITEKPVKMNDSFYFQITRMISDQIAIHSVQLPLNRGFFLVMF